MVFGSGRHVAGASAFEPSPLESNEQSPSVYRSQATRSGPSRDVSATRWGAGRETPGHPTPPLNDQKAFRSSTIRLVLVPLRLLVTPQQFAVFVNACAFTMTSTPGRAHVLVYVLDPADPSRPVYPTAFLAI